MPNERLREIAVYAIRKKQGEKYFLLKERGKVDIRVPIPDDLSPIEALRNLVRTYGPATFTLMNDVGPNFAKHFRIAALDDLVPPSESKQ
jgi:hypothetical protein